MQRLADEKPVVSVGTEYIYSDENFAVLGEIVRRVSGLRLDIYSERYIFTPLQMRHTRFRPPADLPGFVIAPTLLRGSVSSTVAVHDPTAARMGGVSGHAGLFSTADDLARFARMLLNGGELDGVRVLQSASITAATSPQSPTDGRRLRGLGWALSQPSSSVPPALPPASYGHTGYTGTLIWIDPASGVYAIILTNRTYPDGRGDAQPLRDEILARIFGTADGPCGREAVASGKDGPEYPRAAGFRSGCR
jgi:CubicO group peptidase (beta-lactamase class C family)